MMLLASGLATLLVAMLACAVYRVMALRQQWFDLPNERSSHQVPTPRGGGVGILLGLVVGVGLLAWQQPWPSAYSWLVGIASLLMLVGCVDDSRGLPVAIRLPIYALACALATWVLAWPVGPVVFLVATLLALWLLNLYNFMDGIDGIAAAQAIYCCLAAAGLGAWYGAEHHTVYFCLLIAAACAGFLPFNWAPARLFMGDAGSVPLGFLLACLAILGWQGQGIPLAGWLILLAVFIGDATLTLAWRAITGQRLTQAHRQHLYQRLARHWSSHRRVVMLMTLYNLAWLTPLAAITLWLPGLAWLAVPLAYLPLALLWFKAVKLP